MVNLLFKKTSYRKAALLLLILVLSALTLAGCGHKDQADAPESSDQPESQSSQTAEQTEPSADSSQSSDQREQQTAQAGRQDVQAGQQPDQISQPARKPSKPEKPAKPSKPVTKPDPSVQEKKAVYSVNYLLDEDSQRQLDQVFAAAGISAGRRDVFWHHVRQVNSCDGFKELKPGWHNQSPAALPYDPYELQDAWTAAYPGFPGYNCRITAFSLMGDFIDITDTSAYNDLNLFMDIEALESDPSALIKADDMDRFKTLYSTYATENTKNIKKHVGVVQKAWKKAGITFRENPKASLISIYFHDQFSEDENELAIGHTGVLFDLGGDGLLFVEKLAFQEPYDVIQFKSRQELADYMMKKYDLNQNQPTARPFIMENDRLMEV